MNTATALKTFRDYQKSNLKPHTVISYRYLLDNFEDLFGERELASISSEELFQFLELLTEHSSKSTKRHRHLCYRGFSLTGSNKANIGFTFDVSKCYDY